MTEKIIKYTVVGIMSIVAVPVMIISGGIIGAVGATKSYIEGVSNSILKKDLTNENPKNEGIEPEAIA